jgi:hypothetical protein
MFAGRAMRANDHRVNRLARQALIKLGRRPEHHRLYCVQLMHWGLEGDALGRDPVEAARLRESVAMLDEMPAAEAMAVLKLAEDAPARPGLQPRHLIDKCPRELAASLLQDLGGKLLTRKAWFSPSTGVAVAAVADTAA